MGGYGCCGELNGAAYGTGLAYIAVYSELGGSLLLVVLVPLLLSSLLLLLLLLLVKMIESAHRPRHSHTPHHSCL